jgi:hypothetical protein
MTKKKSLIVAEVKGQTRRRKKRKKRRKKKWKN